MRVQDIDYAIVPDKVFVLNMRGQPLSPASQNKSNRLIKEKKAHVVSRSPFIIQLDVGTGENVPKIILKIDCGYSVIGFSCVTEDGEELLSGELVLDNDMSSRLTERNMYRKDKRNRLWYREPRWENRTKPIGWLPPSVQRRYDTHLHLISFIKTLLPIAHIIIETAQFDIQKILNPDIQGTDYQKCSLGEYSNMRAYLLSREQGKCQYCKKDFKKGQKVHIHHCKQRSESGSNRAENLAPLHVECHKKIHKQGIKLPTPKSYRSETFMNILHKRIPEDLPEAEIAYGYETYVNRIEEGLSKTHYNDAYCIGGVGEGKNKGIRRRPYEVVQRRRHNRSTQLNRKGYSPSIKTHIYKIQPKDLVWVKGKKYKVNSMHSYGKYVRVENKKDFNVKYIEKVYTMRGLVWE